jgi:Na+/melibiose symporter-like transporter
MERYRTRTNLVAIATVMVTIIVAVIIHFMLSPTSSWSSVGLVVVLSIITISVGIFQIFSQVLKVRERRAQEQSRPIRITLQIDREPITVETTDTERVKAILKLVRDLETNQSYHVDFEPENTFLSTIGNSMTIAQKQKTPEDSETNRASEEQSEY